MKRLSFGLATVLTLMFGSVALADPQGAPGIPHRWAPAAKQAVGTAFEATSANSPVWFTIAEGIVTEVFYPRVDTAQVGDLQFIVTDGEHFFSEQKRDTVTKVSYEDEGMVVRVSGEDRQGRYSFDQEIVTDSAAPVLRVRTHFHWNQSGLRVFVLFKPAINNAGAQNLAYADESGLVATRMNTNVHAIGGKLVRDLDPAYAALLASAPWSNTSAGYVGFSDGWQDLSRNFHISQQWHSAGPGNIALTGELEVPSGQDFTYELALGFGTNRSEATTYARTSLGVPFESIRSDYESGWNHYLGRLEHNTNGQDRLFFTESSFVRRSAEIIKMHEDKRTRGAIVASLSKPAVPDSDHGFDGTGGYHLIWPRDLYHAAMGLLAAGDNQTPLDVLRYYVKTQHPDGSWAQNTWVDGTAYWHGLQMDEVAFPILLANQLQKRGVHRLASDELEMVRRAASFLMSHGPTTQEDRWEEIGGYVPSTLAAEIAALKVASQLTKDSETAATAQQWSALVESWTLVTQGPLGNSYYLRSSPSGNPDGPEPVDLANGAGHASASEILDGGFLDLVRMGVRGAEDPRILSTMKIYESPRLGIAAADASTPEAAVYRRYNRDQYGMNHVGGFWPLLAGERGHYAIAAQQMERARAELFALERSAMDTGLIPEQTINPPSPTYGASTGLGVACPLVWAHAEDILLHRSLEEGLVFDAPGSSP
ncbi:MAG: glycoside hydrolase family 15 protein [Bdellovibrionota bacterium]